MKRFFKPKDTGAATAGAGAQNGSLLDRRSFQIDQVPNKAGVTPFPVDLGREQAQLRDRDRDRERKWQQQQQQQQQDEAEQWTVIPNGATAPRTATTTILSPRPISSNDAYPPPQPAFYLPPGASPPSPQLSSTPPPNHTYRTISKQHSIPNLNLADSGRPSSQVQFPTPITHNAQPQPRYAVQHSSPQSPLSPLPNPHSQQAYQPNSQPNQTHTFAPVRQSVDTMAKPQPPPPAKDKDGKKDKKFFGIDWGSKRDREREMRERERESEESHGQNSVASHGHWTQPPVVPAPIPQGQYIHTQQPQLPDALPQQFQSLNQQQYSSVPPVPQQHRDPGAGAVRAAADVGTAIREICAMAPMANMAAIADLCERVNHSDSPDSVVKDAARSIRKEFKHGTEPEKVAAARVWLYMMGNCGPRGFRTYATNKKFMASLEPILTAPLGRPVVSGPTQQVLMEILAGLVYQYGADKGSEPMRDLWLKVKLPQDSDMGYFLPADHWIFGPVPPRPHRNSDPPSRVPSNLSLQQLTTQAQVSDGPGIYPGPPPPRPAKATPPFGGPTYTRLADPKEDLRRLLEECAAAKESARVLSEALVYTKPEQLNEKDVIKEFHAKSVRAQMSLMDQMAWASSLADKSKSKRERDEPTAEEQAFAGLLDANEQLSEALKLHEEMEKMARDEREMQAAEERSRKETRLDRSQAARLIHEGSLAPPNMPPASASRSPSPMLRPLSDLPAMRSDSPSSEGHPPLPPPPKIVHDSSRSSSPRAGGPRPLPNPFKGVVPRSRGDSGASGAEDSSEENAQGPKKPSAKALGKRRAPAEDDAPKFDIDDLFKDQTKSEPPLKTPVEGETLHAAPIVYAYDAFEDYMQEKKRQEIERNRQASRPVPRGPGGGSSMLVDEPNDAPTTQLADVAIADGIPTPRTASPTPMIPRNVFDNPADNGLMEEGMRRKASILSKDAKWRWRK